MNNTSNIFFSSDPHFFHSRILEFCNRPYKTAEEMNEGLINNWNSRVSPKDTIYCLGDFSFGSKEPTFEIVKRLNGKKILILGNHDSKKDVISMIGVNGWSEVHDYLEVRKLARSPVALFHFPIESWNAKHYGSVHLHGHTHGNMNNKGLRRFDVGVDCWDMSPVSWEEIKAKLPERDKEFEEMQDTFKDRSFAELFKRAVEAEKSKNP